LASFAISKTFIFVNSIPSSPSSLPPLLTFFSPQSISNHHIVCPKCPPSPPPNAVVNNPPPSLSPK
jgi:hypothetical protein